MVAAATEYEFLKPLVTGWLGKIAQARKAKQPFTDIAEQCMAFFSGACGFMWEEKYRRKYIGGKTTPNFRISMAKAFELVAIFGPVLYHRNPIRTVRPRKQVEFGPDVFGDMNDPQVQMMYQQAQMLQAQKASADRVRCQLTESYLNYTPNEQPGGGLQQAAEDAITEALVKGRGCLWTEPYVMPGSDQVLTGCFYDSVDHLFIDPDCENCTLDDAGYIIRECIAPHWEVEREYDLPRGTLKGKGSMQSGEHMGASQADSMRESRRADGTAKDLITYYKIWSKSGVGTRLTGIMGDYMTEAFDDVVGDYAYIVVCPNCPYPLNAPRDRVMEASDEEVAQMFAWPVPYWRDKRWPVQVLDFYRKPRSAWPIAPMAPGLGELTFLNVVISHLCNRIWSSSRDLIAVLKSASAEVRTWLERGEDQTVIPINEASGDINKVIQFLQQPPTNFDVWKIIDAVMELFDKRVGLSDLLYGLNPGGSASRSATDIQVKQEKLSIRPDYMAGRVEKWLTEVGICEKFCMRWYVEGKDLAPLFGPVGAHLYDMLITTQDPEVVIREMECTVEAGSARKPNKDRDVANMSQIFPALVAELSKHADITSDTNPLNSLLKQYGDAIDQDVSAMRMGPRQAPPPSPEQQQMMQMQQQMEMAKLQADIQKANAAAAKAQGDAQGKQNELAFDQVRFQQDLTQDAVEFNQETQQREQEHKQDMRFAKADHDMKIKLMRAQAAARPKPAATNGKAK